MDGERKPWLRRLLSDVAPKEAIAAILIVSGSFSGINGCVKSQDAQEAVEASDAITADLKAEVRRLKARIAKLERRAVHHTESRRRPKGRDPVRRFFGWIWPG